MNLWLVAVGAVAMCAGMLVGKGAGDQPGCLSAVAVLTLMCGGFVVLLAGTGWA